MIDILTVIISTLASGSLYGVLKLVRKLQKENKLKFKSSCMVSNESIENNRSLKIKTPKND